ncbi:response regulator [Halomonas urumqiensis]|uniref:Two-component system response regulator UvrY n=1 Tax=Halomonas urumqiensis TaxID=1684789 RepID=A0A2N7UQI5_9GAMM|nr:response regulator [Halomonas urumqiensis]PMR82694.1 two-component system response regulator UvrY [Halomonas urumqiensis]PTB01987.1 two-component system response regulator UvrY [Halomonas urumqiensis]GHE22101.1 response regulator GacA [Halomonas urumqiensis]
MIRVLIADDHHLVRTSIAHLLNAEADISVVGEVSCGEDAIAETRRLQPDVVLMDIRMPGIGGLEATRKIHRIALDTRILVLSAWLEDSLAQRFLDAGAYGFIGKGAQHDEMVAAIRGVFGGHRYVSAEIAQRLVLARMDAPENPFEHLSQREMQVAIMIINCHKVAEISDRLFLSPKTVNTYRYRIFEKLGVHTDVELTHLGLRHGLVEGYASIQ